MRERIQPLATVIAAHLRKRGSLRRTLLIAFLLLTLPLLIASSAVTTWLQYDSDRQQTIDQLTSVSILKEAEITTWFDSLAPDLELVVANPRVRSDISQLITTQHNEFVSNAWRGVLLDTFIVARVAGHKFEEIFLMDTTGTVIVSTTYGREGQSFNTQPFFEQGLKTSYVQAPSYSQLHDKIVIFAAVPVRDERNVVQGVLAGVANLDTLNGIMQDRTGLGDTGETYLVNSDHAMLTRPRAYVSGEFPLVNTQGARAALNGRNGWGLYENYRSPPVSVVGVYRRIPGLNIAQLAEQSQAEAFEDTVWAIWRLLGAAILVAVLTVSAAFIVSRSIATPLEHLTSTATRIAAGDFTQMVAIERADEIGTLGNAFNTMTTRLRELINNLEQRVAARTAELQKARDDLDTLYQVTATSSQALDLATMLTKSLARTVDALHSDGGVVYLLDEIADSSRSPALRLFAHVGIPPIAVEQMDSSSEYRSLMNRVIEQRETMLIPDVAADSRISKKVRRMGKGSFVLAPLRAEGQVWGVLCLTRMNGEHYRTEETALFTSIADQVGVAVRGDHLRQRAQQVTLIGERQRLARDLHDSATQALYSVTLFAEAAKNAALSTPERQHYLTRLSETALQALKEMRLMIYELRPAALEQEGLISALRRRLESVEHRAGVEAQLEVEPTLELPIHAEGEMYRIAQEALNNILKHSASTRVTIRLKAQDSHLHLEIEDNGKGFDVESLREKAGIGLSSMRERAERLGGTLEINSTPGEGTCVQFRMPLTHDASRISPTRER